jgi:exodeoxyribonuclease-3
VNPSTPPATVRALTLNLQRASAPRTGRLAAWLTSLELPADVLVLTEVSAGDSGEVLAQLLTDGGYHVVLPKPAGDDRYRVLVACRDAIPEAVDIGADQVAHRCVAVRIPGLAGGLAILGLYVPSRGPRHRRNQDKRMFQDHVSALLPTLTETLDIRGPVVITGDLNVVEPDHEPRYAVFGKWEYDFYRDFGLAGFVDAFRVANPTGMDYSWFGRPSRDGQRNGYRIDHAFVTSAYRDAVLECRYDHSARALELTDHSALTLTLTTGGKPVTPPAPGRPAGP